jgi:hypothetical protein
LTAFALVVYALLLAAAAHVVWRRPAVAFALFLVGLAFHNAAMDALYAAGVHGSALSAIQAWKDVLLLVALARVGTDAARARRLPFTPMLPDAFALAFAVVVVVYALIPQGVLDGNATHKAVAYALRHDLTGVGAYFLGRAVIVRVRDVRWPLLILAAVVAAWGLVDVYAIHLGWWRHNGTVGYFHKQLGFDYGKGLSGLPENFVYNTGNEQDLLRRLVSTFLSPLATAYLCVVALLLAPRRRAAIPFAALAAAGLLWTHTRAALIALALGFLVLAAIQRRAWPVAAAFATLAVGFAFVKAFPHIGPRATFTPAELKVQRANAHPRHRTPQPVSGNATSTTEPSTQSHVDSLRDGIRTVVHHPQGFGLGNAGEVASRTGVPIKAGESNYTELGVETGLLGALLFMAWNLTLVLKLVVARRAELAAVLVAVLVIAVQTDAYGIPWLAYCVWWLAGSGLRREPS